jgi:hypothetical protein
MTSPALWPPGRTPRGFGSPPAAPRSAIIETSPGSADSHALLPHDIPRTSSITAVSAHYLLHTYLGGPTAWRGRINTLTEAQQQHFRPPSCAHPTDPPTILTDPDHHLLAVLLRDGRASYTDLTAVTGCSASTATRRVEELRLRGALFFNVEMDDALLGITASVMLWMSVAPAHLDHGATTLADHQETRARRCHHRPVRPAGARTVPRS